MSRIKIWWKCNWEMLAFITVILVVGIMAFGAGYYHSYTSKLTEQDIVQSDKFKECSDMVKLSANTIKNCQKGFEELYEVNMQCIQDLAQLEGQQKQESQRNQEQSDQFLLIQPKKPTQSI